MPPSGLGQPSSFLRGEPGSGQLERAGQMVALIASRSSPEDITRLPPTQTPSCPRHTSCSSDKTEFHPRVCCAEIKLAVFLKSQPLLRNEFLKILGLEGRKFPSAPRPSPGSGRSLSPVSRTTSPEGAALWWVVVSSPKKIYPPSRSRSHYFAYTSPFYLEMSKQTPTHFNLLNKT